MVRAMIGTALFLFAQCAVLAQTANVSKTFEVASVKTAAPLPGGGFRVVMGGDAGRLNYSNVGLKDIIAQAYQVKDYQISGPDWVGSQRFDIRREIAAGYSQGPDSPDASVSPGGTVQTNNPSRKERPSGICAGGGQERAKAQGVAG